MLWIVLLHLFIFKCSSEVIDTGAKKLVDEIFESCDIHHQYYLDEQSLEECFTKSSDPIYSKTYLIGGMPTKLFVKLVDQDNDGRFTKDELFKAFTTDDSDSDGDGGGDEYNDSLFGGSKIEMIDRYGNTQKVSSKELYSRIESDRKDLSLEDGKLTKRSEGQLSLDKAEKEKPEVAELVKIGRWVLEVLPHHNWIESKDANLMKLTQMNNMKQGRQRLNQKQFSIRLSFKSKLDNTINIAEILLERIEPNEVNSKPFHHLKILQVKQVYDNSDEIVIRYKYLRRKEDEISHLQLVWNSLYQTMIKIVVELSRLFNY